jgi:EAL domain-containing protein (putative c-di-GMP-specific phosphodiesterase class I)
VAVNVSAMQLAQPGFLNSVKAAISGQPAGQPGIDLEVTESMLMTDVESSIRKLEEIRSLGMEISIDDFGTGYSSLSYLAKLPVNMVKIDRSFIVVMTESAEKMSIVSTIITLAHSMNLKVIAEGVDSPEQLKFLRLLRCDEIQGFLFSKPLPADELATLIREDRRLT